MILLCWSGCLFDTRMPGDVEVRCSTNEECAADLVCVADTGRCTTVGPCIVQDGNGAAHAPAGTACDGEAPSVCLDGACVVSACGDGALDPRTEECDDGNQSDADACTNVCAFADCGDGVVQEGEQCDDGNDVDTDACRLGCQVAVCGDGIARTDLSEGMPGYEACDDGNLDNTDGCTFDCAAAACGDGFVQLGEECDDGNDNEDDACTTTCRLPECGDGAIQQGEECDDGNDNDDDACVRCAEARCGDGVQRMDIAPGEDGFEECDDGNADSTDGCTVLCREPGCGDFFVQVGEECDDGNEDNTDSCTTSCSLAACGDGYLQPPEQCDDGNLDATDACTDTCLDAVCGDGIPRVGLNPGDDGYEECDDGNGANADACLSSCVSNVCGDGELNPESEQCDDSNTTNADGCSAACTDIAWTVAFSPGDLAPGRVALGNAGYTDEHATGEIPSAPDWLFVVDQQDRLFALDPRSGLTLWQLDLPGTFAPPLLFLGDHLVFILDGTRLMGLRVDDPTLPPACNAAVVDESFCVDAAPGRTFAALSVFVSSLPPAQGGDPFDNYMAVALMDNGDLSLVGMPGGNVLGSPSNPGTLGGFGTLGIAPEAGLQVGGLIQFGGSSFLVPRGGDGIRASGNVCGGAIDILPADPLDAEPLLFEIAIITNGLPSLDGDLALVRGESGRVFEIELPETSGTVDPCPPGTQVKHLVPRDVSRIPVMMVPVGGNQIIWVDDLNRVRRGAMNGADVVVYDGLLPTVAFDPAGGTADAEGGIYLVDTAGGMIKMHVISKIVEQTWVMPAPVSSLAAAPMVAGRLVYVPLSDGRLVAFEGGGPEPPLGSTWSRSGGSHYGPGHLGCAATDAASSVWWVLLGLGLLGHRRRRAARQRRRPH